MEKLKVGYTMSFDHYLRIPPQHIEDEIKHRLAMELAVALIDKVDWKQELDQYRGSKIITATVNVATDSEVSEIEEIKKALKTLKGVM